MNEKYLARGASLKVSGPSDGRGVGCHVELNGEDISHFTRSLTLHIDVDSVVHADLTVFPSDDFVVDIPIALVNLRAVVLPGFVLIEEYLENGQRRWRAEREPAA